MNILFLVFSLVDSLLLIFVIKHIDTNFLLLENYTMQVKVLLALILVMCWILAVFVVAIIQRSNLNRVQNYLMALGYAGIIYGIGLVSLITTNQDTQISLDQAILIFLLTFFLFLTNRMLFFVSYKLVHYMLIKRKSFIIIGNNDVARKLINHFSDASIFIRNFKGIFDEEENVTNDLAHFHLGYLDMVKQYCLENRVDEIYYTLPINSSKAYLNDLRNFADEHFIFLGIVPDIDFDDEFRLRTQVIDHRGIPVLSYERSPLAFRLNRFSKRILDVVVSSIALILLGLTVFPIIALIIKLNSKGPVFFKQLRSGRNCKPFYCYKFRTMKVNNDADKVQATKNDSRITSVGSFLRKTSLDELPQFYNVFLGEMSVVGPRPHMLAHTEHYSSAISKFKVRHTVDAGITGYAQVNGYRGETKELSLMEQRVLHDKWYLENWSLVLDVKIIFLTIINMIKGEKTAY